MKRKTINIDKLDRETIATNDLQEVALLLIKTLYMRSDEDYSETMEKKHSTEENVIIDKKRVEDLRKIYYALKELPPRPDNWRHNKK